MKNKISAGMLAVLLVICGLSGCTTRYSLPQSGIDWDDYNYNNYGLYRSCNEL